MAPAELSQGLHLGKLAHVLGTFEVLADLPAAPSNAARVGINKVAFPVALHKVSGSSTCCCHYWFPSSPSLQHDNTEGLIPARHHHCITSFEECLEMARATLHGTRKVHCMANPKLLHTSLQLCSHMPVSNDKELGISTALQDVWDGVNEQIWPLLNSQPPNEQEHWVHGIEALVTLCVASPILLPLHVRDTLGMNPIVDHLNLGCMDVVVRANFLLQDS
mmetsp:Transcript_39265/g.90728  ORF Transcript_39265/g.90728 Transcript_39265/m.90728 type:complete len:220 (+) Transcript_39265:822-1481(+)